jgi:hypothetical protein
MHHTCVQMVESNVGTEDGAPLSFNVGFSHLIALEQAPPFGQREPAPSIILFPLCTLHTCILHFIETIPVVDTIAAGSLASQVATFASASFAIWTPHHRSLRSPLLPHPNPFLSIRSSLTRTLT